jgi:cytochrome P450
VGRWRYRLLEVLHQFGQARLAERGESEDALFRHAAHYAADPRRFDVTRRHNPHLAFGHGPRYCIGAPLARVELRAVFSRLFSRFPTLRLAVPPDQLRKQRDLIIGGFPEIPVTW